MASCNFLAPNGQPSLLHASLSQLLDEKKATTGWYTLRSPRYLEYTGNWVTDPESSKIYLDPNGEPTLQGALELLGLGSLAHVQQHRKFIERWKNPPPVPGKLNEYYAGRPLVNKMVEQLKISGYLYNLIQIRYNPLTATIEIIPRKVERVFNALPPQIVFEEPQGAEQMRASLEQERDRALNEITKPLVDMSFIEDSTLLNTKVNQVVEVEGTGEQLTRQISVGKWQAQIKKEFEIFKKLVNCI